MTQMTQAEYARTRGVSRAAITKWKKEGRVVMNGDMIDVEASDTKLKRTRRYGLAAGNRGRGTATLAGTISITPEKASQHLAGLDWSVSHDWSEQGLEERAMQAARCIGWAAVRSDAPFGDGQWGGFQLRDPALEQEVGLRNAIIAGYGYELSASEVVLLCREELQPDEEDENFEIGIRGDLLSSLALPIWSGQHKSVTPSSDPISGLLG